jgi:hypothetical protein
MKNVLGKGNLRLFSIGERKTVVNLLTIISEILFHFIYYYYYYYLFPLFICAYNDWVITPPSPCSLPFSPTPRFQADTVLPLLRYYF